ncbi:MAG: DUF5719 family protein [Ilumatobacteraceae bacterium]|nr:hypothetical protein [Acidimicrobiales bacterium]MCB9394812.1 hypothetical protein [Acidimicrobiaceae bacterium]
MRPLRSIAGVVVAVALAGLGVGARDESVVLDPVFANLGAPTMPFVPAGSFITSSWFCPGVLAGGTGGGRLSITNTADEPIAGRITALSTDPAAAAVEQAVNVAPRSTTDIDLAALQPTGTFVSALVEIDGGGGFVEQVAEHPAGAAVASCANAASSNWWFADGFTVDDSTERLVLTNPYPDAAIVDIRFVTADGIRRPSRLQGYPVPGRSVEVITLGELGARDEPILAAQVTATRGRVVAGRAQHYVGGGRLGFTMTLGAPSLSSQLYFADGETGAGISESYAIYNPTDADVTVDAVFLGLPASPDFANDTQVEVPAGRVVTLDTATIENLPAGRHGAVFSTFAASSIVVERVVTRPAGNSVVTTVVMGSPPNLASTRWSASVGVGEPVDDALVVLNVDSVDTTVVVSTLGPGGLVPVPGLEAIPLPAGGVITVPFTDPSVVGRAFVVASGQRIFVERSLPRGGELAGRSGSFPLAG